MTKDAFDLFFQEIGEDSSIKKVKQQKDAFDLFSEEEERKNPSTPTLEEKGIDVGKQIGLGVLERWTYPLDILKSISHAVGTKEISEIEDPEARSKAEEVMNQFYDYFPTQELAEKFVTKHTGIQFEPQTAEGKKAREFSRYLSLQPGKILGSSAKQFAKKATGAAIGAGGKELATAVGVPEPIAEIIGAGTAAAIGGGKSTPTKLSPAAIQAERTASKFNLPKAVGMNVERKPLVQPVVSKGKEAKLKETFDEASKKAINEVISQKIPVKQMRDRGINLQDAYTKAYSEAENTARFFDSTNAKLGKTGKTRNIDLRNVIDYIKKETNQIKSSAPSLSKPDKVRLGILREEYKALTNPPAKPSPAPKTTILNAQGNPIPAPPLPSTKRKLKKITAVQSLDQIKNYNENVKGIYKKPEFSGAEEAVRQTYAGLNEKVREAIGKANPKLGNEVNFANKIFGETQKLTQTERILKSSFDDGYNPTKLNKTLSSNRNRQFLERNIGKDGVKDLEEIAKYGERAQKLLFDRLKNPQTIKEYFGELTPLKLMLLTGKTAILPGTIAFKGIKSSSNAIQGYLFTRDGTRKSYKNYLKAAASNKPELIRQATKQFDDAITKEFGSEEELIKLAQESEE